MLLICLLFFRGIGGLFVDCSWNWWTFLRLFVELVDFSWIFHGIGGFCRGIGVLFMDFSWNWWTFRGIFVELVEMSRKREKYVEGGFW